MYVYHDVLTNEEIEDVKREATPLVGYVYVGYMLIKSHKGPFRINDTVYGEFFDQKPKFSHISGHTRHC